MRNIQYVLGTILLLIGLVTLVYEGFTYTKHEQVAQIGDVRVMEDTQKTVYISPWFAVVSLAAGIVLIVAARRGVPK